MAMVINGTTGLTFNDSSTQSTSATAPLVLSAGGNFQTVDSVIGGTNNTSTNILQSPRLYVDVSGTVRIRYYKTESTKSYNYGGASAQARGYIYKNGSVVSGLISANGTLDVPCAPGDYFQTSVYNLGDTTLQAGLYISGLGFSTFPRAQVAYGYTF